MNIELLEEHLPKPASHQHLYMCDHIELTQALIAMLMKLKYPMGAFIPSHKHSQFTAEHFVYLSGPI